jgi:hypothetical protein
MDPVSRGGVITVGLGRRLVSCEDGTGPLDPPDLDL